MSTDTMLQMLKIDLGITANAYDERLSQYLLSAQAEIQREGVTFPSELSAPDANLVIQYAAWMWRRRDTGEGMPRMIRWQLNNRLFEEKSNG